MGILDWVKGGDNSVMSSRRSSLINGDEDQSLLTEGLGSLPNESSGPLYHPDHPEDDEHRYIQRRIRDNPMWTLDRGTGFYVQERLSKKKASLLGSNKDAGKSMVNYQGIAWSRIMRHIWKRDFFTTAVHARFQFIVLAMICLFISTFLFWAVIYYAIWRWEPKCFLGFHSFLSAFLFSIETQNTIGYGSHAIGDCWLPAWLVGIQCILAVLLEAIFLGIIFAKISHPKGRSRTIVISECACIARRDGILKFMFRVADLRKRTAIAPRIVAHLYTWGPGHTTAEGEHIPVQVQDLPLHFMDHTLLLPVVLEHTVDERSPLYGHTSQSLDALSAEIVITFEGHSELGDAFMTRISYLPNEIHWGCKFVNIITQASPGSMKHSVDLSRFHEVEPQEGLALMPPSRLSHAVVRGGSRRIPRPRLGENTLQLADELVVTQAPDGTWFVAVRVGDAYPSQMCGARVQMFVYRYNVPTTPPARRQAAAGAAGSSSSNQGNAANAGAGAAPSAGIGMGPMATYVHQELALTRHLWRVDPAVEEGLMAGYQQQQQQQGSDPVAALRVSAAVRAAAAASAASHAGGGVNVLLRYPVVVGHEITPDSPLKEWITHDGMLKDADAEIVVVTSATQYCSSRLAMRSKVYSVLGSIRWGCSYGPCVVPPSVSPTGHALVDWNRFHDVTTLTYQDALTARAKAGRTRHPPSSGTHTPQDSITRQQGKQMQQQQQQQQGSSPGAAAAWFAQQPGGGGVEVGASWGSAVNSSQQQQQQRSMVSAPDAFEFQVEEMLRESCSSSFTEQRQQQQQQRASSAPAPLDSVVVHQGSQAQWQASSSSTAAAAVGQAAASIPMAVALRQKQQQQQMQHQGSGSGLGVAHSLGFDHFHDVAQMQARLQQQLQQRLSQASSSSSGLRQGISSAEQLHDAAAAAVTGTGEFACAGGGGGTAAAAAAAMAAVEAAAWGRRRSSAGSDTTAALEGRSFGDMSAHSAPGVLSGGGGKAAGGSGGGGGYGSGPSSEAAVRHAVGGGGWGVGDSDSSHTFKGGGSHKSEEGGKRSLATVMDLFQIAEQEMQGQQQGAEGEIAAAPQQQQQQQQQ